MRFEVLSLWVVFRFGSRFCSTFVLLTSLDYGVFLRTGPDGGSYSGIPNERTFIGVRGCLHT